MPIQFLYDDLFFHNKHQTFISFLSVLAWGCCRLWFIGHNANSSIVEEIVPSCGFSRKLQAANTEKKGHYSCSLFGKYKDEADKIQHKMWIKETSRKVFSLSKNSAIELSKFRAILATKIAGKCSHRGMMKHMCNCDYCHNGCDVNTAETSGVQRQ